MQTLGDRIRLQRRRLGMTQQQLAVKARVLRPRIAALETNAHFGVASETLKRLAIALSCTTDYLVGMYAEGEEI